MTVCQNCDLEKLNCKCPNSINKGNYYEATTQKFYKWEELMEFYKTKSNRFPHTNPQD